MQINKRLIQTSAAIILIFLCSATAANSQTITAAPKQDIAASSPTTQNAVDECAQLLDKTLDAYEKLKTAKSDVDAELLTNKDLLKKEQVYNDELLKAVALLTSSEKRNKSFFLKLREQIGRVLMNATDPKTITSIIGIILILDRLKK